MSLEDLGDPKPGERSTEPHGTPANALEARMQQIEQRIDNSLRNLEERVSRLQEQSADVRETRDSVRRAFKRIEKLERDDRTSYGERTSLREMVNGFRASVEDLSAAIKDLTMLPERVAALESKSNYHGRALWMLAGGVITVVTGFVLAGVAYFLGFK